MNGQSILSLHGFGFTPRFVMKGRRNSESIIAAGDYRCEATRRTPKTHGAYLQTKSAVRDSWRLASCLVMQPQLTRIRLASIYSNCILCSERRSLIVRKNDLLIQPWRETPWLGRSLLTAANSRAHIPYSWIRMAA